MDKQLLEILACPLCKGDLEYLEDKQELVCNRDQLAYPIEDDIPILISDQARALKTDNKS